MHRVDRYRLLEKIHESRFSAVYRARRTDDGQMVRIKFRGAADHFSPDIDRIRQEYETLQNLDIDGIARPLEIFEHDGGIALVFEDFQARPLKDRINGTPMDTGDFLDIAIRLSEILGSLHKHRILHKAIKPSNILVGRDWTDCRLTDFGLLPGDLVDSGLLGEPEIVSGTLPYIAPEQTGRMNRGVDGRTDLYSLGAVFYEMLTGRPPFVSDDPMEIIHSHIARFPRPPSEVHPAVAGAVSDLVMKLLCKAAEDRYQSAFGLMSDLRHCRRRLSEAGRIEPFALGRNDFSPELNAEGRLVAREKELEILRKCFSRMAEQGRPEVAVVRGDPGTGKSMLVAGACRSFIAARSYCITGRYDSFRGDVPYSAVIQALMSLISQILAEGPERIEKWRKKIQRAVGSSGRVITEVIPSLSLVLGEQPGVPDLGPEASRNRFIHVLTNFIGVFARPSNPLVLFLDNLQWADRASLRFIASLTRTMGSGCLLLILAYRGNEAGPDHPLARMLGEIAENGPQVETIELGPFSRQAVNVLVADLLRTGKEPVAGLADCIYAKTGGNPLFVRQFVQNIHEKGLLVFDPAAGWHWDMEAIDSLEISDNVGELMAGKIGDLPAKARQALMVGACIGNRFDLETLSAVMDAPAGRLGKDLEPAVRAGFLQISGRMCHFSHERLREAAYRLIAEPERARLHHDIGWHIYRTTPGEALQKNIFYIVNHLNAGRARIRHETDRTGLARLNLLAGKKARNAAAYQSARTYLLTGIGLLDASAWERHYAIALDLYTEAAKAAYLNADFSEMEGYVRKVTEKAASVLDSVDVREIQVQAYLAQRKIAEAVDTTYHVLSLLGVRLPRSVSGGRRAWELAVTELVLRGKKDEEIINYRPMADPFRRAAVRIAKSALIAFYIGGYAVETTVLVLRMVRLGFRHGVCAHTPQWLASYSVILFMLNRLPEAFRFGDLALKLADRLKTEEIQTRYLVAAQTRHWRDSLQDCCRDMLENYTRGMELGDVEYSSFSAVQYCHQAFGAGRRLDLLGREVDEYTGVIGRHGQMVPLHLMMILQQVIENLRGASALPADLAGARYNEDTMIAAKIEASERAGLFLVYTYKLILGYLFGQYEKADRAAEAAKQYLDAAVGLYMFAIFYFYRALNQLAQFPFLSASGKKAQWNKIENAAAKLRLWARHGPHNYAHKKDLLEAEMARLQGDVVRAETCYHRAAEGAKNSGFLHEEALAWELGGFFYAGRQMNDIAGLFMGRAHACYERWGAFAKARRLKQIRPDLFREAESAAFEGRRPDVPVESGQARFSLDLSTVVKAYQAISGEIVLEKLLERLMRIGIENAGGQRGVLLLNQEGRLRVEAEADSEGNVRVLESIPLEQYERLPASVVSYVHKSMENVVLEDARADQRFAADPYIRENRIRSVLCAPIRRQDQISGLLYVENNLTSGAFTRQRLELLTILSAQAAIAIENAKLFEMARRDGLTGLINHRYFLYCLETEMARAAENRYPITLFMMDIDYFKHVNDTYGHQAGDAVLRKVAGILREKAPDRDLVSRYGGEEFALICPERSFADARSLAEEIRQRVAQSTVRHRSLRLRVTISIGIAGTYLPRASGARDLIRRADRALYEAKAEGKNRVVAAG